MTNELLLDTRGLIPAIAQDIDTGHVLILAYMNIQALKLTIETKEAWFYSRSRQQLWNKGETSGNKLRVHSVSLDCDRDALLLKVTPVGPTCHTGQISCFHNPIDEMLTDLPPITPTSAVLENLYFLIKDRQSEMPAGSYTVELLTQGIDRIGKKVIEEAAETVIAAKNNDQLETIREISDLLYHLLVLMAASGVTPNAIWQEMDQRRNQNH